jgi:hypothetical protein
MLKTLMAIVLVLAVLGTALPVLAGGDDVYVRGYIRRDGTYVQPHWRSAPDGDRSDNWSTQGNFQPVHRSAWNQAALRQQERQLVR